MKKRGFSLVLILTLCFGLAVPSLAAQTGFVIRNGVLEDYKGHDRDIVIPDNVSKIESWAFYECVSIESVTIPSSVTSIGDYAFMGCTNLKRVIFPESGPVVEALKNADFYDIFRHDGALEEIVNCPNTDVARSLALNEAFYEKWVNPGQYVEEQSDRVKILSNQICAGATSDYEKAKAVFDWMTTNIGYDYEYYYGRKPDVATSVEGVLDSHLSVCSGYSKLTQALLQAQGIPALVISGASNGARGWPAEGQTNHDWNMAFVDGRWIYIDSTWGRPGTRNKKTGELYDDGKGYNPSWFDPTVLFLSLSHRAKSAFSASGKDTPSDWAKNETWNAICAGVVPNDLQAAYQDPITREDFCRLMIRLVEQAENKPISVCLAEKGLTAANPFTDTDHASVPAAHALGIVSGTTDTTFTPNGAIKRQEAAAMLSRTAKILGLVPDREETFSDAEQFAAWAKESIAFISSVKDPSTGSRVMGGMANGTFSPAETFSRQQAIATVLRLFHCAEQA